MFWGRCPQVSSVVLVAQNGNGGRGGLVLGVEPSVRKN